MRIAVVSAPEQGRVDRLLTAVADRLLAEGRRIVGAVQTNTEQTVSGHCDMDVQVLPSGPVIRISQDLGAGSKGCRLDAGALEEAVALVEPRLADAVDMLIINKFGKHESEGRGFRTLIAEALSRDIPVLVGVGRQNREAFEQFTEGFAVALEAEPELVLQWCRGQSSPADA